MQSLEKLERPRKILIFSLSFYPLHAAGAEVAVKEITDRIPKNEIEFNLIALADGRGKKDELFRDGFNIHYVGLNRGVFQKLTYPFLAYMCALKLERERHFDATWAIMASYAGFAAMLFKFSRGNIPYVLTLQEGENFGRRKVLKPIFKLIFRSADAVTAISQFLADWSKTMCARVKAVIVPNGADLEHFSKMIDADARKTLRSKEGFIDTDIILITTSRLVHKNAVDDLVRALGYLDASYKLLILGTGPDEEKLRKLASEPKYIGRVTFKGQVAHGPLPDYLKMSDIFVRASRTEGLGNSFLEAMAAGIPVIATPVGGIPDFLIEGETGLFCEVNNPRSIAQKVEKLTKDRESRDYIVKQASKMVNEKYGWSRVSLLMKNVLTEARPRV